MKINSLPLQATDLRGLSRLAIDGVLGVTDLVEHLHAGIAAPHREAPERTGGLTRQIYRSIRGVTRGVGQGIDLAFAPWASGPADAPGTSPTRHHLQAAINGVLGDHLEASRNPLALDLRLQAPDGHPGCASDPDRAGLRIASSSNTVVVFLHGLCLHPGHWNGERPESMPARIADSGRRSVLHAHYNSGRSIAANGRDLSAALERLLDARPDDIEHLVLIGHSMGGLVARSAEHDARLHDRRWNRRLRRIITLGSPHQGAPLERLGHGFERVLGLTRYTLPFVRIGATRSTGITDLRHGRITAEGTDPDLPQHATLHLIAGSRSAHGAKAERGDGLVPIASALAAHRWTKAEPIDRLRIPECGHLALMHHPQAIEYVEAVLDD
jgi:pimeloyl-ACP methyl ester carboxylesterase